MSWAVDRTARTNQEPWGKEVDSSVCLRQGAEKGRPFLPIVRTITLTLLKGPIPVNRSKHLIVGKGFELSSPQPSEAALMPTQSTGSLKGKGEGGLLFPHYAFAH